ncbi:unnamed protein product, partial [Phaeothamnion confervicola]
AAGTPGSLGRSKRASASASVSASAGMAAEAAAAATAAATEAKDPPSPLRSRFETLKVSVFETLSLMASPLPTLSPASATELAFDEPTKDNDSTNGCGGGGDAGATRSGYDCSDDELCPAPPPERERHARRRSEPLRRLLRQSFGEGGGGASSAGQRLCRTSNKEVVSLLTLLQVPCEDVPVWAFEDILWADFASSVVLKRRYTHHALALTHLALYMFELQTSGSGSPDREVTAADVRRLRVVARLEPADIECITLPYAEVVLEDGTEVAQRTADIVVVCAPASAPGADDEGPRQPGSGFSVRDLSPRGENRRYIWLRLAGNDQRGDFVEALDEWYARDSGGSVGDLPAEQAPEASVLSDIGARRMSNILEASLARWRNDARVEERLGSGQDLLSTQDVRRGARRLNRHGSGTSSNGSSSA